MTTMRGRSGIFADCFLPDNAPVDAVLLPDLFSGAVGDATDEASETLPELRRKDVLIVSVVSQSSLRTVLIGNCA